MPAQTGDSKHLASSCETPFLRLRDVTRSDLAALHALDQVCYPPGIAYSLSEMRYFLTRAGVIALIAEDSETRLAGFVIAQPMRYGKLKGGHVVTIDVAAESRRKRVATHLMDAVERRLVTLGAASVRLEVAADNLGAQCFYIKRGFAERGRIKGYYMGVLDALSMKKSLP